MEVGDTVVIKDSGRRARIIAALSQDRFQVEYVPDLAEDPIDRDSSVSAEEGGIYHQKDLAPLV